MKLAHLILAHAQPEQLKRLVKKIISPHADVYIHLDKKSDMTTFAGIADIDGVSFISNRTEVYWGTYSIVQATLNAFDEILKKNIKYSHINLLSAQDYPLKSAELIQEYLFSNPDKTFIHALSVKEEWTEALDRVYKFNFGDYRYPGHYALQHICEHLGLRKKIPENMVPYGRSQWLTIAVGAARHVIDYLEQSPDVKRYFRMSFAPDEFIFQTILMNSKFKNDVVNDNLRHIDFTRGGYHPKTLTIADAISLTETDKFYARKFDPSVDSVILNYLDWIIDYNPEVNSTEYQYIKDIFLKK